MTWSAVPLKRLVRIRVSSVDKKSIDGEVPARLCNYTDVYYRERIRRDQEFMTATATREQVQAFRLEPGDVVVTKDSETANDIGVSAFVESSAPDLVCGYHLAILRPRAGFDGRFLFWSMASAPLREQLSVSATGVTRFGLRSDGLGGATIQVPPLEQQRAIADFLDAETARIDGLITKKRRMTELLAHRRSSTISKALWADSDYTFIRLKHLAGAPTSGNRDHGSFTFTDAGVPCLRGLNIRPGRIDQTNLLRIASEDHRRHAATALVPGDVVVVRSGLAGAAALIPASLGECNCVDLVVIRGTRRLVPQYVELVLNSREVQEAVTARSTGALLTHFNAVDAGELRIPYRSLERQHHVVRHLQAALSTIDAITDRLTRQIELLQEHRQALITAAVTGELDVAVA